MTAASAFANEAGSEILQNLRAPEFMVPTLILPVAFYSFFALATPGGGGQAAIYLLATYGVFAVMGPSIFGFGVSVATEREKGWLQLKRVAPASAVGYILAKLVATLMFASISVALVYAVAGFAGGVALPRGSWALLLAVHVLSAIPFVLIGLTLGFSLGANAAVAVVNIVFLGLAALGGLWLPISMFPEFLKAAAVYLPSYHLGEVALWVVDREGDRDLVPHLLAVAGMSAGLSVLALLAWSRQR